MSCVNCGPWRGVAGGAVAARCKGLAAGAICRNQAAVRTVTTGTAVMGIGRNADQDVVVAACAVGCCDLNQ